MNKSPRTRLLEEFKISAGADYSKMLLALNNKDMAFKKLKCYVAAITKMFLRRGHISIIPNESDGKITITLDGVYIETYSLDDVIGIEGENSLAFHMFIEYGSLSTKMQYSAEQLKCIV